MSTIKYFSKQGMTRNQSVSNNTGFSSDTYLVGSSIRIPGAGLWEVGSTYFCRFDMAKTGAGTAAFAVTLRIGTAGTTSDASICAFSFTAGTANADLGMIDVYAHFRTVGSGTSAVVIGNAELAHHLAATGLTTLGAAGFAIITTTSSGFNSTTSHTIGLSVNGGSSFSGTNTLVESGLIL